METVTYNGLTFQPYITHETVQRAASQEIGKRIGRVYAGKYPLILCVLTGAGCRRVCFRSKQALMRVRSYV